MRQHRIRLKVSTETSHYAYESLAGGIFISAAWSDRPRQSLMLADEAGLKKVTVVFEAGFEANAGGDWDTPPKQTGS